MEKIQLGQILPCLH